MNKSRYISCCLLFYITNSYSENNYPLEDPSELTTDLATYSGTCDDLKPITSFKDFFLQLYHHLDDDRLSIKMNMFKQLVTREENRINLDKQQAEPWLPEGKPDSIIDFYRCKFKEVHNFTELLEQFYVNLGGNCLRDISTNELQNALGIGIIDMRGKNIIPANLPKQKTYFANNIIVKRYSESYVISATEDYLEKNYSIFPKNIFPKIMHRPSVSVIPINSSELSSGNNENSDYMLGNLYKEPFRSTYYMWMPVKNGSCISFKNYGNNRIEVISIGLKCFYDNEIQTQF